MKTSSAANDGKIFTIEDPVAQVPRIHFTRLGRIPNHYNIFKWFITINIVLLLVFCGYALWTLYQLESAMRSNDEAASLSRYYEKYDSNKRSHLVTAAPESANDSMVIADFQEWKKAISKSLDDLKESGEEKVNNSDNLTFLLNNMSSAIKNLLEDHKLKHNSSGLRSANSSESLKSKLIKTNLTDMEVHILKEFTKIKLQERNGKSRFPRTIRADDEKDNKCNLNFSLKITNNDEPVKITVKPANKNEGMVRVKNSVNYMSKGKSVTDTQECSFNIFYEPNKGT